MTLLSAMVWGGAFTPSSAEISQLDNALSELKAKEDTTLKANTTMIDKLISSHNVTGGYENSNYRYIYYMNLNDTDRLAIFIITQIKNPNFALVKSLNMQEDFVILIDANSANKVVWSGYAKEQPQIVIKNGNMQEVPFTLNATLSNVPQDISVKWYFNSIEKSGSF